jgi:hypothetical protein
MSSRPGASQRGRAPSLPYSLLGAGATHARDALFIPAKDFGLLFSPGSVLGGGYGAKGHNLKVDLKDI